MRIALSGVVLLLLLSPFFGLSQDLPRPADQLLDLPSKFFSRIDRQAAGMDKDITAQTEKYLDRLAKKEATLRKKLYKKDSVAAKKLFENNTVPDYSALAQRLQAKTTQVSGLTGSSYSAYLDSISTSLKFLQQNKQLLAKGGPYQKQLNQSLARVNQLQGKLQVAEQVKQLVRQRKQQFQQALSQYSHVPSSLRSCYQGYTREVYYYGAQLKQYRDDLDNPDKLTKRAISILNQSPIFEQFMKEHSELASLFSLPGGGGYGNAQALEGLQTRSSVQQLIGAQVAAGGPNAQQIISQEVQSAQAQLHNLKDKVNQLGGGSSNIDMPDFRPNGQKTKPFLKRLEYGFNIQTSHSTYYFPTTTDIGLSLGYKANDNNQIGIGASYKIGWGKDIQHITITSQGLGLRSFVEIKIKGSFFASGGVEYNYQRTFQSLSQLRLPDYWTKSGLIGVTKKYKISNKLKGNLQLLWDFLSYQQVPKTQAIVFRLGYNF